MKILFLINSLAPNGAERSTVNLLNYLPKIDPQLNLYLYLLEKSKSSFPVPDHVKLFTDSLHEDPYILKFLKIPLIAYRLKQFLKREKINIVISALSRANYVNIFSKFLHSPHRCIITEMNVPSMIYDTKALKDILNRTLKRQLYKRSDSVIAVSAGVKNDLTKNFNVSSQSVSIIYLPWLYLCDFLLT